MLQVEGEVLGFGCWVLDERQISLTIGIGINPLLGDAAKPQGVKKRRY
jgi:hypothetical protein